MVHSSLLRVSVPLLLEDNAEASFPLQNLPIFPLLATRKYLDQVTMYPAGKVLDLLREEQNCESKEYKLNSNHKESLDKLKYFHKITGLNSLKMIK